jgi:hypothetical protein
VATAALDDALAASPPQPSQAWSSAQQKRASLLGNGSGAGSTRSKRGSSHGKGKQKDLVPLDDDEGEESDIGAGAPLRPPSFKEPQDTPPGSPRSSMAGDRGAYPPTSEEEIETRRIEDVSNLFPFTPFPLSLYYNRYPREADDTLQNLRRWEHAERQRRKSARTSSDRPQSSSSSVLGAAAAYFFPTRRGSVNSPTTPTTGGYSLPLDDVHEGNNQMGPSPLVSPQPTPRASTSMEGGRHRRDGSDTTVHGQADHDPETTPTKARSSSGPKPSASSNPFVARSPFDDPDPTPDPGQATPMMEPSMSTSTDIASGSVRRRSTIDSKRPAMLAASSYSASVPAAPQQRRSLLPPPAPISIPDPITPPPRSGSPVEGRAPEPHERPDVDEDEEGFADAAVAHDPPVRWWTDWLCGLGPHREGDSQAGKTNPFE